MIVLTKSDYIKLVIMLGLTSLAGCDGDPYHGFGCIAPESHPAVSHARSLSPEQLEEVYFEVHKLSSSFPPYNYETEISKEQIPDSLQYLDAELIRISSSIGPQIVLADCFDESVELGLSPLNSAENTITLFWSEPTNENPYQIGKQILWRDGTNKLSERRL